MRALLIFSLLMVGVGLDRAGAGQINNGSNDFNGYQLTTPLSDYPAFRLVETWSGDFVQEVSLYENPQETLTLNGVSFLKVRYRFADGRLESIQLVYEGFDNRAKLLEWIEERYGKLPSAERKTIPMVLWYGDQMTITLSYNKHSKRGMLWFTEPSLHDLVNRSLNSMPD